MEIIKQYILEIEASCWDNVMHVHKKEKDVVFRIVSFTEKLSVEKIKKLQEYIRKEMTTNGDFYSFNIYEIKKVDTILAFFAPYALAKG